MATNKPHSEADSCDQFITPAIQDAGWDRITQVRREYAFTAGRVVVRGKMAARGKKKRADYLLFYQPNLPLAVVEAKDTKHSAGAGMQQALFYAEALDVPFAFSTNGKQFVFHDRTGMSTPVERVIEMHEFPSPASFGAATRPGSGSRTRTLSSRGYPNTTTAAARSRGTTSASPSRRPSRQSREAISASCS